MSKNGILEIKVSNLGIWSVREPMQNLLRNQIRINISQKAVLMADSRPVTRSLLTKAKEQIEAARMSGRALSTKQMVEKWMSLKAYEKALDILSQNSGDEHWMHCKRGQIEINMKHLSEGLRSFEKAFSFKRKGCTECLEQLIRQMEKGKNSRDIIEQLLSIAREKEELPSYIKDKIQQLRHAATPKYEVATCQLNPAFYKMLEHYHQAGAKFKKLEVRQMERDFRIAVAKKTIKPHENIIKVPQEHIITLEKVKKEPHIRLLHVHDSRLKSPKHSMLSVYLLNQIQLGQQSEYYAYIQCLPKQIKNFPVKYPKSLLAELEGTSFLEALLNRKEDIQEDFATVRSILGDKANFTLEKFIWARMLVSSRIFGIIAHGVKTDALVPLADMLNHKIPKMTTWSFCDEHNSFIVQNLDQPIYEGEEIFDSYGSKCNSRFLLNYGFVQPNNLSNEVLVQFKPYKKKKDAPCFRMTLQLMSDELRHVLSYYREAAEQSISDSKKGSNSSSDSQSFISNENELQAWKWIKASFKERIRQYKTTIKGDQKLLEEGESLSFNLRNCIEVRLGEKKILDFYIKMARRMIQHFGRKKELDIKDMVYEPYFADISGPSFASHSF